MVAANKTKQHRKKSNALAMAQQGMFAEAGRLLAEICKDDPRDLDALQTLGRIHGRLGEFAEAEDCFRKVLNIVPDAVEVHCLLGNALQSRKDYDKAEAAFSKALALRPDHAEAWFGMGSVCQLRGLYSQAAEHYRKAISFKTDYVDAYGNLGLVLRALGMSETAESCLKKVLQLRPGDPVSCYNLGNQCHLERRYEEAVDYYRKALKAQPRWKDAIVALTDTQLQQGHAEDAMRICRQALEESPGNPDLLVARANIHERLDELDEAWAIINPLAQSNPNNVAVTLKYAKLAKRNNAAGIAIDKLESLLQQESLDLQDQTKLHFAAGALYDSLREYDRAFSHYSMANSSKAGVFDMVSWRQMIDELVDVFSEHYLSRAPHAGTRSERPVFIVGMPRSGTTLTEQILSRHPAVHAAGELPYMKELVKSIPAEIGTTMAYPACAGQLTESVLDRLAATYLNRLDNLSRTAKRVSDKIPGNFLHLGLIEQLFPEARIIHCTRDPADTCLSNYVRDLGGGASYSSDLTILGEYYCAYRHLMAHWLKVVRLPIMEVKYEEMVKSQESVSKSMVEFCGLEWDERCLTFYDNKRVVDTPSYDQVRRPIYTDSVQKWRKYEKHLSALISALAECSQ